LEGNQFRKLARLAQKDSFTALAQSSTERRKTKTKVITLANRKGQRKFSEPIKTERKNM